MIKLAIVALFLITVSFTQGFTRDSKPKEYAILEAVFRHQMKHCCLEVKERTFYLSLGGKDPNARFMQRFAKESFQVKAVSQEPGSVNGMYPGIRLNIDTVRWKSKTEAEVIGTCSVAPMNGGAYFYMVVRQDGRWVVKESRNAGEF